MSNPHIGSNFDDFLAEDGLLAECQAEAMKRVIAWQIDEYLKKEGVNKSAFAKLLETSRSQPDRLLDPDNTSLNPRTLSHAAEAMGNDWNSGWYRLNPTLTPCFVNRSASSSE